MAYCVDEPLPKAQDLYAYFLIAYFADSYYGIENKFYNYAFGGGVSGSKEFTEEKFRRHCSQANVAYHIVRFLIGHGALDKHYRAVLHVISNLINDNIASLRACGKAKVPFRAENIFAEAWVEGMLWQKLSEHIFQEQDRPCARLLFEILFKILKMYLYGRVKLFLNTFLRFCPFIRMYWTSLSANRTYKTKIICSCKRSPPQ